VDGEEARRNEGRKQLKRRTKDGGQGREKKEKTSEKGGCKGYLIRQQDNKGSRGNKSKKKKGGPGKGLTKRKNIR